MSLKEIFDFIWNNEFIGIALLSVIALPIFLYFIIWCLLSLADWKPIQDFIDGFKEGYNKDKEN